MNAKAKAIHEQWHKNSLMRQIIAHIENAPPEPDERYRNRLADLVLEGLQHHAHFVSELTARAKLTRCQLWTLPLLAEVIDFLFLMNLSVRHDFGVHPDNAAERHH